MKGGATFNQTLTDDEIRDMVGSMCQALQFGKLSEVYRSPRRLLVIQEVGEQYSPVSEAGNLHAMLITLHPTLGDPTIEFFPATPNYYNSCNTGALRAFISGKEEARKMVPLKMGKEIYNKAGVSAKTQTGQILATELATKPLTVESSQLIARMAGLTPSEKTSLQDVRTDLAKKGGPEAKQEAIIDAALAWVKAWNAEHVAKKGEKRESAKKRKELEKALVGLESGKTKFQQPIPSSSSSAEAEIHGTAAGQGPNGSSRRRRKTRTRASRRTSLGRKTRRR